MKTRMVAGIIITVAAIAVSMALTFQTFDAAMRGGQDPGLGLVINPPSTTTSLGQIQEIYERASATKAGRTNMYVFWSVLEPERGEYEWLQYDILARLHEQHNLSVTLYFSIINGGTLGPFPDWVGRPSLISIDAERVALTINRILDRYDMIDSVVIAGEADEHFRYNEQSIPVYAGLFDVVYGAVKEQHPDVKVGNVYSLHGVSNKNLAHIVDMVPAGDFVGFNYFPVDLLNDITKTPDEARADLGRALELAGGNRTAFFEVGWSTSGFVGGSEGDQQEFLSHVVEFYGENRDMLEFVTIYRMYDMVPGSCNFESSPGTVSIGSGEFVVERLGEFVCNAGLLRADGAAKPAWDVMS